MHDCGKGCGQACDCDGEDTWLDAPADCTHECEEFGDDELGWIEPDDAPRDLGRCCVCMMKGPDVRNICMQPYKSPTPGFGWGCVQCGLPPDGAIAVVCDDCLGKTVRFLVAGYPYEDRRVALLDMERLETFEHDMSKHPEAQEQRIG